MDKKKLDQLIVQLEHYLECWKQFNHYLSLARTKKFEEEDERKGRFDRTKGVCLADANC